MRYIDAFCHFNPKRYHDELLESPQGKANIGKRVRGIPALWDLDVRLKVVDQFPDYSQVISLGMPMVDRLWGPDRSPEMARIANDGLAEVVAKHPDRFAGYSGTVAMNAPDTTARQGGRARTQERRQRHPDRHQRQRQADRRQGVLAGLRDHRQVRAADPAAPGPRSRELVDYAGEDQIEVRNLFGAGLAL